MYIVFYLLHTKHAYLFYIIGVGDLFLITNLIVFFHHSMFAYFLFYHWPQDLFYSRANAYKIIILFAAFQFPAM